MNSNPMRSSIYTGSLWHRRLSPQKHEFTYPVYFYLFDLAELENLNRSLPLFSYNRWNLASIDDRDYLNQGKESIQNKLHRFLREQGFEAMPKRVELITCARFLGYVFNPVSFYLCYNNDDLIESIVAEVRNTFGEMHLYHLVNETPQNIKEGIEYRNEKVFHVSPFFDRAGEYQFRFKKSEAEISIQVNLLKEKKPVLLSLMKGQVGALSAGNLLSTVARYPLTALMTIPRIHGQALKLYFQKKLKIFRKPFADHTMTIRVKRPSMSQSFFMKLAFNFLSKLQEGKLELILPNRERYEFGGNQTGINAEIHVYHYDLFKKLIFDGGIGLGESYMDQLWNTTNLTHVLRLLIQNKKYFSKKVSWLSVLGDNFNRWRHLRRKNTLRGSRRNIQEHYDLSNSFYELFLDKSMTYSSAFFQQEDESLDQAQQNKLRLILDKARIGSHDHVLEIGCGWGALGIKAVKETGCRWTGVTLSQEQLAYAQARVKEEGLEDKIQFKLCDYRVLEGKFDKIVSVEMLEAVGHEYLGAFFKKCNELLADEGICVLQVITIPDQRYLSYRRGCDFIQKHIFPGGHLPSLSILSEEIKKNSELFIENLENIGPHYAKTLKIWREQFLNEKKRIENLGFSEKFMRKWEFYFTYCEAAFCERYLNNLQLVLTRVGNKKLNEAKKVSIYARSEHSF